MKSMKSLKLCLIVGVMMLCCGCSLFKTKINLSDYISYSYEGIDGYTSIAVSLNTEGISTDYNEKVKEEDMSYFAVLLNSMEISASKTDNLCNGDVVTLHVTYNEAACESAGIVFSGNDVEITIEGLEEGILLDLFADVSVNVKGTAPIAVASIENKSANEFIKGLTYTLDKTTGFWAGEELIVTCNVDERAAKELGYVILHTSKTYKTDEMDAYVQAQEDIDMNMLSEIVAEAKNTVISETEGSQTRMLYKVTESSNYLFQYNKEWIDSIELQEVKLLTSSDVAQVTESKLPYNKLYVIFKAYVTNADHGSDGYFCFEYSNLIRKADGTLSVKHDNQNLRYLCDDDYNELMTKVAQTRTGSYAETAIDISFIVPMEATVTEDATSEETNSVENN